MKEGEKSFPESVSSTVLVSSSKRGSSGLVLSFHLLVVISGVVFSVVFVVVGVTCSLVPLLFLIRFFFLTLNLRFLSLSPKLARRCLGVVWCLEPLGFNGAEVAAVVLGGGVDKLEGFSFFGAKSGVAVVLNL